MLLHVHIRAALLLLALTFPLELWNASCAKFNFLRKGGQIFFYFNAYSLTSVSYLGRSYYVYR